jgi:hypothetical protein
MLRQASRRSWRIGQKEPVRVAFFTYSDTAQESCLRLMGKKLMVSLAMEGKLHAEGLQAMDEDDDLLTAMARELVTRQGVGEQAAEIWRALTKVRETATGGSGVPDKPKSEPIEIAKAPEESQTWIETNRAAVQLSLYNHSFPKRTINRGVSWQLQRCSRPVRPCRSSISVTALRHCSPMPSRKARAG